MDESLIPNLQTILHEILENLQELKRWARIIGFPISKNILEAVLDTNEKKIVYHLMDGVHSIKEIETISGVNVRYVSEWGKVWESIGILEQSHNSAIKGRRQKVFDLVTLGISIPDSIKPTGDRKLKG